MEEFFDMGMFDADAWRDRPDDAPEETREPAPWVDRPGPGEYTATAFDGQTYQANGATPSAAILALVACIEGAS